MRVRIPPGPPPLTQPKMEDDTTMYQMVRQYDLRLNELRERVNKLDRRVAELEKEKKNVQHNFAFTETLWLVQVMLVILAIYLFFIQK